VKIVAQRVNKASVKINGETIAMIQKGLVLLTGISDSDTHKDIDAVVDKICNLRIFESDKGKMNLSVKDINAELLVVSQFTLLADLNRGRRPSFTQAASPDKAEDIYNQFISGLRNRGIRVESGRFREYMQLELINDGPATFIIETNKN